MKNLHILRTAVSVLMLCISLQASAQDVHYSQFNASPLNLSPGLVGAMDGDHRFMANFRQQWRTVQVPYLQFAGGYDQKIHKKDGNIGPLSAGLQFNYDRAGSSRLTMASLGGILGYRIPFGKRNDLNIGAGLEIIQRSFDTEDLIFGDQWQPYGSLTQTAQTFDNQSAVFPNLSGGATATFRADSTRSVLRVGFGGFHLNKPNKNFQDEIVKLDPRWSFYMMSELQLTEQVDARANVSYQSQGPHSELVASLAAAFHIDQRRGSNIAVWLGLGYRFFDNRDAIFPMVGMDYNNVRIGASYDVNLSGFTEATAGRGGPELSLIYTITHPKEDYCEMCPKYL